MGPEARLPVRRDQGLRLADRPVDPERPALEPDRALFYIPRPELLCGNAGDLVDRHCTPPFLPCDRNLSPQKLWALKSAQITIENLSHTPDINSQSAIL